MTPFNLIDLNLLRVFDVLFEEGSVTRAGSRLGVTQSAVSHALARLRELLGDELFIKGTDGMAPTARARALGPRVRAALVQVQAALLDNAFDPATATARFTIAANPVACTVMMPGVARRVRASAPGVELRIVPTSTDVTEPLDTGRLDLAISDYGQVPDRLDRQDLLHDRLVWVLRADHPAAQAPLTLECLAGLPHLVRAVSDEPTMDGMVVSNGLARRVAQDGEAALHQALAAIGRQRQVRLTAPNSHTALAIVAETDLVALVPWRVATALAGRYGVRLFDPPYPSPGSHLSMVWHRGHGSSPGLTWLRTVIAEAAESL